MVVDKRLVREWYRYEVVDSAASLKIFPELADPSALMLFKVIDL